MYDFSTGLIRYFVGALRLNTRSDASSLVEIEPDARREVEVLKQFIWEYVIENPDLAVPQNGQRIAIRNVFTELLAASHSKRFYLFPPFYQDVIAKATKKPTGYVSLQTASPV